MLLEPRNHPIAPLGWLTAWVHIASAHPSCIVGVDLGISECNRTRVDEDTTSLRATAQESGKRAPHRGDGKWCSRSKRSLSRRAHLRRLHRLHAGQRPAPCTLPESPLCAIFLHCAHPSHVHRKAPPTALHYGELNDSRHLRTAQPASRQSGRQPFRSHEGLHIQRGGWSCHTTAPR